MALNIKNEGVERLVAELAAASGKSKTDVVRSALAEVAERSGRTVSRAARIRSFVRYLEEEIWPSIPGELGTPLSREEKEELLGYGPEGV